MFPLLAAERRRAEQPLQLEYVLMSSSSCFWSTARALLCVATVLVSGCGQQESSSSSAAPALAQPAVTVNHERAPAGSPLEITYRFVVAPDAAFPKDYRVMAHVVDADEEMMWTDDHDPPVPTSQWKPGQTVEYTRTVFVPVFPYVGQAAIHVGLYSAADQSRLTLSGDDAGQHAYRAARLQIEPQSENLFTVFKEGWHAAETPEGNRGIEWQWTKKDAVLAFKNPRKDARFYLEVDNPSTEFHDPQKVTVAIGNRVVDEFTLTAPQRLLRTVALPAAAMGAADMAEMTIAVDRTFVPAIISPGTSKDSRELGVRVFHAFIDAR